MRVGVTGGNGLLGRAVVAEVANRGHDPVSLDLRTSSDHGKIEQRVTDIRQPEQVEAGFAELDAVIHTASLIDLHLGEPDSLRDVNVVGAQNVIDACRTNGIDRLVHMSSAEAISGAQPLRGVTEADATYPNPHLTYYGVTKQAGEELVLDAADDSLGTCAMRTYGLFGPGDNTVIPLFLDSVPGKLVVVMQDQSARTDVVHAPNLAHSLVLAAEQLTPDASWSGTPFHITDGETVNAQQFLSSLVEPLGYKLVDKVAIPRSVLNGMARLYKARYDRTGSERFARPPLTDHKLRLALDDYYLDSSKARTVLGYEPPVSRADAIEATQEWLVKAFS